MSTETINPNTGTFITLSQAEVMVSDWISLQGSMSLSITDANPKAMVYGKDKIQDILDQQGCVGIRIYNGLAQSKRVMVLVGIDSNGDDMTSGNILETGFPCPAYCAPNTSIG